MLQEVNLVKSSKTRKRRLKLGDIYEIPLPNGENAYGRLYKECTLAIYKKNGFSASESSFVEDYQFFVTVYKDLLQDGVWKVVGHRPFPSEDEAWPPPRCVVDAITHKGSLYYRGQISPCSYEQCKDLEVVSVWDRHHLIDRLMGNHTWEEGIRKPKKLPE